MAAVESSVLAVHKVEAVPWVPGRLVVLARVVLQQMKLVSPVEDQQVKVRLELAEQPG